MEDRILVIEDDLALRPMWEYIVRRNFGSNKLDWAVSAEEATRLLKSSIETKQFYALVVVDVFLSGSETGLDFLAQARAMGQKTPMLLVSAVNEADLEKLFDKSLGPVGILSKPLNVPRCERAMNKFIHPSEIEKAN